MSSGSSQHNSKVLIGIEREFIYQVQRILNNYYDSSEVSEAVIVDFILATRSDYEQQTDNSIDDWTSQPTGLNYSIARVAALYVVMGLLSRSFGGGSMSYRIGNFEVDRKDTVDIINVFRDMAERAAMKWGFHPSQGLCLADLTISEISSSTMVDW